LDSATKAADKKNGVKAPEIPASTLKKADKGVAKKGTTAQGEPKTPPAPKGKKKAAKAKAAAKTATLAAKPAATAKVEHPPANQKV